MSETNPAVVKVFRYIGAVVGTILGMITLLSFFFAPIKADLEYLRKDYDQFQLKLDQVVNKQQIIEAAFEAHIEVGHVTTDQRLEEVRDNVMMLNGTVERAAGDIQSFENRQSTIIDQMAEVRAEVKSLKEEVQFLQHP